MSLDLEESKEFAKGLAEETGEIMLEYFYSGDFETEYKEDNSPVTIVDKKINQLVIDAVAKKYPEHAVQGEEGSAMKESDYVWVCDPVDGTTPFAKQIPVAAFSLALVRDGESILGVVYEPFSKQLYVAQKGGGAYCNDKKIFVSEQKLDNSVINVEWWQGGICDVVKPLHEIAMKTQMYHIHLPSIVYASVLVASGKLEASVFPGGKGKNVDIAAIKVIVEEAGGRVTDLVGNEQRYDQDINGAIISNGVVHDDIVITLKQVTQNEKDN